MREPNGLLAAGGDLGSRRLLAAYRRGIFPWYEEGQPLLWWSPDPRCVFLPGDFRLASRLRRDLKRSTAEVRFNTAFDDVIRACAGPRRYQRGTWITRDMRAAYNDLHAAGWAHSIEIWQNEQLVGGLYGLIMGRAMFGESMFSTVSNASKIALLLLSRMLDTGTLGILDCQVQSSHLVSLGASLLRRADFAQRLDELCEPGKPFENWPNAPISVAKLMQDVG
ncbi:MAG: leucyl/phenylalanyl-tRNA--protein transferase [Gammaproteobacteria bacterium]|nr:leucyl/phenylalanyl-tRNA--protein transferase [Gammaproteobacteria bacterium]